MPEIEFSDRVAIVTGAGAGLGRDYALQLGKRGAKVVVNDLGGARDGTGAGKTAADQVVDEIKAAGGQAVPNYDDVSTTAGGENIVKTALDHFGKVDILINNAGILRDKTFVKMEENSWDAVLNVHLKAAYNVTRPAFINMRQNQYGRIILTSSVAGVMGNFGQANYGAAKMGLCGLTNVLKLEGAKYNINVNVILPSAGTRMTDDVMPPEMFERLKVEYITPAVLYMCSEQFRETGLYINAYAGYFSRSAILTGPGVAFKDLPTPEQIKENWDKIVDMGDAKYYEHVNEFMADVLGGKGLIG
ncbi:MAG: SDR family oxidoreductase [Proteobacteria bacterium]|nr:SDR family oxidoreductase [Pseudomonadota bacterium]